MLECHFSLISRMRNQITNDKQQEGRKEGSSALIKRGVAKQPRILSGDKLKWPNRGFKEGGRKRTDGRKAATTECFGKGKPKSIPVQTPNFVSKHIPLYTAFWAA